jgi:hypothetical protein
MRGAFAHFIRTNRNAFAVAMLCVLVLKGFSFLGMAASIAKYPEASSQYFSAVVLGAHCEDRHNGEAPQDQGAHHADCCALCSSASRDVPLASVVTFGAVIALLAPTDERIPSPITLDSSNVRLMVSVGVLSRWSSEASEQV